MIKNVFFDLDSTLLLMNQDLFLQKYLSLLSKKAYETYNINPKEFINNLMTATQKMLLNDGEKSNEIVFWEEFRKNYQFDDLEEMFEEFYNNEFKQVKEIVKFDQLSKDLVMLCKKKGFKVILATNPIFPMVATRERMKWAGLDYDMFSYVSTYENSSYSKPNKKYFTEICEKLNLNSKECLMVGNDLADDFKYIGNDFSKFLVTDYLINTENAPIDILNGSLQDLYKYIENL